MSATLAAFDVQAWSNAVMADGFSIRADGCVVSLAKQFTPGDLSAFSDCDSAAPMHLASLPRTQLGSTWGTDGNSVGGYSAVKHGQYCLKTSGVSKRVVAKLAKIGNR